MDMNLAEFINLVEILSGARAAMQGPEKGISIANQ
jgi:hypothetical protein